MTRNRNVRRKSGAFSMERRTREFSVIARDLSIRKWKFPSALICIYKIPTALDALSAFISCDFRTFRRNLVKANSSRSLASSVLPLRIAPLHRSPWCSFKTSFEAAYLVFPRQIHDKKIIIVDSWYGCER